MGSCEHMHAKNVIPTCLHDKKKTTLYMTIIGSKMLCVKYLPQCCLC